LRREFFKIAERGDAPIGAGGTHVLLDGVDLGNARNGFGPLYRR
jgi:hypothetical protein